MPIMRVNVRQTSFFRKMTAYYETWKQGIHTSVYGIENFRVLTVTSSPERVENLIQANRGVNDGRGSRWDIPLCQDRCRLLQYPSLKVEALEAGQRIDWLRAFGRQSMRQVPAVALFAAVNRTALVQALVTEQRGGPTQHVPDPPGAGRVGIGDFAAIGVLGLYGDSLSGTQCACS